MKYILFIIFCAFTLTISAENDLISKLLDLIKIVKTEIKAYDLKVKYDATDSESAGLLAGKKAELKVLLDNLKLAKQYIEALEDAEKAKKDYEKALAKYEELYNKVKRFIYNN